MTIGVDGYGSFGSSTPGGLALYDPIGAREQASTVYESAVYFSPIDGFLSTDNIGTGSSLPEVQVTKTNARTAVSQFSVGGFAVNLTQTILGATDAGSTFVQKYEITNNTGEDARITLARHVDGDLFFEGGPNDDFGGVSSDAETLYEFDSGDDPASPTTFFGITSEGGSDAGYTLQPFRYSNRLVAADGIPAADVGVIAGDANGDRVTDAGYDVTLTQQRRLTIPAGATRTYTTSTIFGEGSIETVTAAVSGCIKLNDRPIRNRAVILKQSEEENIATTTDSGGCYTFQGVVPGKLFQVLIRGPKPPLD